MQYQEFVKSIQQRASIDSSDEALTVIRATLQTLADHLAGNAPAKLAAQLPQEIGAMITDYKSGENAPGERFGVEEFVNRVGMRAGIGDTNTAALFASMVFAVLQDAVSREEFDKVRGTFPDEYNSLFDQGNSEAMSTRY